MAINWSAYEAAKELYGNNKENIADIGSRFPLFSRSVAMVNNEHLLDILGAIPKVSARVVETGLKDLEETEEEEKDVVETEEKSTKPVKEEKKEKASKAEKAKKAKVEELEEEETEYDSMTSKELYKLCCERGISSQCKKRDKASLIAVLVANDGNKEDEDEEAWDDEEEETADPYAGKTAKELYKMCKDRGLKAEPKKDAETYAKLLKKDDETKAEEEDSDDEDDDEWEI